MNGVLRDAPVRTRPQVEAQSGAGGLGPAGLGAVGVAEDFADFAGGFSRRMLASLRRRDQRVRGEWYVSGLLSVPGRKSMRALAAVADGGAAEQSLHHFISDSSWAWEPVRQDLARHLDRSLRPHAWVVDSMAIPKAGAHSVGVGESFRFDLGRVVNSQQAHGVYLAGERGAAPVTWGLELPPEWLEDEARRRRARIPDGATAMSTEAAVAATAAELTGRAWALRPRPVVLDARPLDVPVLVAELTRRRLPFVIRVDGGLRLLGTDSGRPRAAERLLQAQQLADRVKQQSRSVSWLEPERPGFAGPGFAGPEYAGPEYAGQVYARPGRAGRPQGAVPRTVLAGGTRVTMPAGRGLGLTPLADRRLILAAGWPVPRGRAPEYWLSNLPDVPPAALLRLGRLVRRVREDAAEIGARVGIRDFEGRSYAGWHRHVTLCSVAHAILLLSSDRLQDLDAVKELTA